MFCTRFCSLVGFIILFTAGIARAEVKDTVILIDDVEITTSRLGSYAVGATIDRIDPRQINQNNSLFLTNIFTNLTGISVKNYGAGGLATLSIRGGGAAHTAVLWNGLNIQNPMSGMANVSTLPGFLVNEVSIQHGGSGTLFGSGAVGGVVHLNSFVSVKEKNRVGFQVGYGSFNNQQMVFTAKTGDKNYAFGLKLFRMKADNDFKFVNSAMAGSPTMRQTNAGLVNYGIMPELLVKTSANSQLSISTLFQKDSKNIQTLMTDANPNQDNQADENTMISANWRIIKKEYSLNIKSGFIRNHILMTDLSLPNPEEAPIADNTAVSFINEAEARFTVNQNQSVNAGLNYTHESGESTGFLKNVKRDRISVFSSYKISGLDEKLETVFSVRDEFVIDRVNPFTFSLGAGYIYKPTLTFTGNLSRNYRIPAFNDLYWKPDSYSRGNANLKPESGFSAEIGAKEKMEGSFYNLEFSQTLFATSISNMIIWLPDAFGIWTPDNKEKGTAKGVEVRAKGDARYGKSLFSGSAFYSFTKAKIQSNDIYDGKPMIYIPEHKANLSVDYSYRKFSANFNVNYTGSRYSDNINKLPSYMVGNLALYYYYPLKFGNLKSEFRIENLWDTKYQVMAWYAMPLRSYQMVLTLDINTAY